ncbi:MAG TPA: methyltransferase domain-containing protein [Verrucomicrobiae bacterium]|jgi:ubiquinone/menaquinone biosynthesis C-methylase UbiE
MSFRAPPRHFDPNESEFVDRADVDPAILREEMELLEKANRWLGAHRLMLEGVGRLLGPQFPSTLRVLDLGTGLADIPRALVAWARQNHLPVVITAVDMNPKTLDLARAACRDWPEIKLEPHDLRALPYAPESFDLVLCSLALHHFSATDVAVILRRMRKLARCGYIVSDLRRNWLTITMTRLVALIPLTSQAFRQDALQSCRAAFTIQELRTIAQQAELGDVRITRHHWFFRMTLEGKK